MPHQSARGGNEIWRHTLGCRGWLELRRDRMSHAIVAVRAGPGGAAAAERRCASPSMARAYTAQAGQTLAAALLANGVAVVARSFSIIARAGSWRQGWKNPPRW
jgi:hypothetical protein